MKNTYSNLSMFKIILILNLDLSYQASIIEIKTNKTEKMWYEQYFQNLTGINCEPIINIKYQNYK